MEGMSPTSLKRELWLTPAVQLLLTRYCNTDKAARLSDEIARALDGRDEKSGCIRLSDASGFLLYIVDPAYPRGLERVFVWHGPSDGGAFFNQTIFDACVLTKFPLTQTH